jgi:membrane protease subunit (stomatin/prohibitin family)
MLELKLILVCFRSVNLEKRIYGLQQLNEKISWALKNQYVTVEWMTPPNVLQFLVDGGVFEDIFGEKGHLELIKRSVPLVRFLYQQQRLGVDGVIYLMKVMNGKHEAWS